MVVKHDRKIGHKEMTLWQEFREVMARGGRLGKGITVVVKLLACAGVLPLCVFLLTRPPPSPGLQWFDWLIEFVARHTGDARETVAVVIWRVACAVMAVGAAGMLKEAWQEWEHSRKALAAALAAAVAVIGLIAGGVVWWRFGWSLAWVQHPAPVIANAPPLHGAAAAGKLFYYPATLTACGWLVLLAAFAFATPRGQGTEQTAAPLPFGRMRAPDGSENARYLALGLALLAVVALALWRSQKNLASVGSSLPQFFAGLPAHSDLLPWPHLIGLAVLALLAIVGLFRLATGRRGPFPKRGLRGAGGDIFWFLLMAGLWLWGAYLPDDFGWFDALGMPGALYDVNFWLQALYLFVVVDSGLTIALLLGGGGSAGGEIGGNTGWRNRPMTPGRQ